MLKNYRSAVNLVVLTAAVFFADHFFALSLTQYGILPRSENHLLFIMSAPLLHGSIEHLISNSVGFLLFALFLVGLGHRYFFSSLLFLTLFSGLFVWFFARPGIHIGASGVVFGMWTLIIFRAFFEKKLLFIFYATLVILLEGGMIYGLLPVSDYISFEAHIGGALGGALFAFIWHKQSSKNKLSKSR